MKRAHQERVAGIVYAMLMIRLGVCFKEPITTCGNTAVLSHTPADVWGVL